jgi:hypothetical protein
MLNSDFMRFVRNLYENNIPCGVDKISIYLINPLFGTKFGVTNSLPSFAIFFGTIISIRLNLRNYNQSLMMPRFNKNLTIWGGSFLA